MRLVLDTDVLVAALRSPRGASAALLAALLEAAVDGQLTILANVALILEYEAVCKREEHLAAAGVTAEQAAVFVDAVAALTEPVESHFVWRPQLADPSDEMVLEAAVSGRADAVVTFNLRDFGSAPRRFGLHLWLPRNALKRISP